MPEIMESDTRIESGRSQSAHVAPLADVVAVDVCPCSRSEDQARDSLRCLSVRVQCRGDLRVDHDGARSVHGYRSGLVGHTHAVYPHELRGKTGNPPLARDEMAPHKTKRGRQSRPRLPGLSITQFNHQPMRRGRARRRFAVDEQLQAPTY